MYLGQLGEAYGLMGRTEEARGVLSRLQQVSGERFVLPYHIAYVHTGLGGHEAAIDYLERAYEERRQRVRGQELVSVHTAAGHPRFQTLLGKLNLA